MISILTYSLGLAIYWLASFAIIALFSRMILDWIVFFSPRWRPQGLILVVANIVYRLTDPAIRFFRRRVPPMQLGGQVSFDVGFLILFGICLLGQRAGTFLILLAP